MRVCWLISRVSAAFLGAAAVFLALIYTGRRERATWAAVAGLSFASNVFYILSLRSAVPLVLAANYGMHYLYHYFRCLKGRRAARKI